MEPSFNPAAFALLVVDGADEKRAASGESCQARLGVRQDFPGETGEDSHSTRSCLPFLALCHGNVVEAFPTPGSACGTLR